RPTREIEPGLIEVVALAACVRAPHEIGKIRKERQVEIARSLELVVHFDALGGVARHHGETLQEAAVILDRRDDVIGTVARAVLAHMPAFFFVPPASRCLDELRAWCFSAFLGIENGVMATKYLRSSIAAKRFGARVPARDPALRVEHVDRAVLDGVDDEPGAVLAFAQRL